MLHPGRVLDFGERPVAKCRDARQVRGGFEAGQRIDGRWRCRQIEEPHQRAARQLVFNQRAIGKCNAPDSLPLPEA